MALPRASISRHSSFKATNPIGGEQPFQAARSTTRYHSSITRGKQVEAAHLSLQNEEVCPQNDRAGHTAGEKWPQCPRFLQSKSSSAACKCSPPAAPEKELFLKNDRSEHVQSNNRLYMSRGTKLTSLKSREDSSNLARRPARSCRSRSIGKSQDVEKTSSAFISGPLDQATARRVCNNSSKVDRHHDHQEPFNSMDSQSLCSSRSATSALPSVLCVSTSDPGVRIPLHAFHPADILALTPVAFAVSSYSGTLNTDASLVDKAPVANVSAIDHHDVDGSFWHAPGLPTPLSSLRVSSQDPECSQESGVPAALSFPVVPVSLLSSHAARAGVPTESTHTASNPSSIAQFKPEPFSIPSHAAGVGVPASSAHITSDPSSIAQLKSEPSTTSVCASGVGVLTPSAHTASSICNMLGFKISLFLSLSLSKSLLPPQFHLPHSSLSFHSLLHIKPSIFVFCFILIRPLWTKIGVVEWVWVLGGKWQIFVNT